MTLEAPKPAPHVMHVPRYAARCHECRYLGELKASYAAADADLAAHKAAEHAPHFDRPPVVEGVAERLCTCTLGVGLFAGRVAVVDPQCRVHGDASPFTD